MSKVLYHDKRIERIVREERCAGCGKWIDSHLRGHGPGPSGQLLCPGPMSGDVRQYTREEPKRKWGGL